MNDYDTIKRLGSGAFGQAWLVQHKKTGEQLVLKRALLTSEDALEAIQNELYVLTSVRHPNVVSFHQHIRGTDALSIGILMEYCPQGDLRQLIDENTAISKYFPNDLLIRWLRNLASGLDHVHQLNIVHKDLKPDNIFMAEDGDLKIGDFGISMSVATRSAYAKGGLVAASLYAAPEIFRDEDFNYRSDLWSLGVILYELIALKRPFKKAVEIPIGRYEPLPSKVHKDFRTIVDGLLQMDMSKRPRCDAILESALLKSTDSATRLLFASAWTRRAVPVVAAPKPAPATEVDLAIVMDCTGSMQPYIDEAKNSIRQIVEEVKKTDKCIVRLALVEYRDHTAEENVFVTRVHPFTDDEGAIEDKLGRCVTRGNYDIPEAVEDALNELTCLNWKQDACKIVVMVVDAPPHGLKGFTCRLPDRFPDGCPDGHDPVTLCNTIAEKDIVLYFVGCEPNSKDYKDIYDALAFKTGGRYAPLSDASKLTKLILASIRAGMSYASLTKTIAAITLKEAKRVDGTAVDESVLAGAVYRKVMESGSTLDVVSTGSSQLPLPSRNAMAYKGCNNLSELNLKIMTCKSAPSDVRPAGDGAADYRVMATEPSVDLVSDLCMKSYRKIKSDGK